MQHDPRFEALFHKLNQKPAKPAGLLQKVGAALAALAVFALSLTVGVMLFAVVITVGLLVWGYFWWKTRELRKVMREQADADQASATAGRRPGEGLVIEGEVIREVRDDDAR